MSRGGARVVGVLGGLGPEATLDFFAKILRATGARSDQEHLHLIINNNPRVPDRNEAIAGTGPSPGPQLAAGAAALQRAGADFVVMVCNAAHAFQPEIEAAIDIPFLSIVTETCGETLRRVPDLRRVGVLAASGAVDAGLYQRAFDALGVQTLVPEGEARARFMEALYRIKSGDKSEAVRAEMRALALGFIEAGAEAIVAGCTEVPLALSDSDLPCPLISSTDVLVARTIQTARGETGASSD